jgi:DNA-binding NtrC family response regulator
MDIQTTVLLSIPQEAVRQQISEFLADAGCRTLAAATELEAMGIAERHYGAIDVLLCDMPPYEGSRLVHALGRQHPGLKALLICGDPECINRELLPDPNVAFIEKPFAWREFKHALDTLLRPGR